MGCSSCGCLTLTDTHQSIKVPIQLSVKLREINTLQNESYYGVPINQNVVQHINWLIEQKLVDDVIWFKPTKFYDEEGPHAPRFVETDKRNFILDYLEKEKEWISK